MRTKAFTLVELLVVVVILLAPIAIALPVANIVSSRSLVSGCANNLSQIGRAVLMYTDDYRGWLPCYVLGSDRAAIIPRDGSRVPRNYRGKPKQWRDSLARYTKSNEVLWCPADRFRGKSVQSIYDDHPEDAARQLYTSYTIWHLLYTGRPDRIDPDGNLGVRLSALPLGPFRTIYLMDTEWFPGPRGDGVRYYLTQHGMLTNVLLLDGSVRKARIDEDLQWAKEPR